MTRIALVTVTALALAGSSLVSAQLLNKTAPVIVGHYHLNVTSVDAHKKFWVDTLGGTRDEVRRTSTSSGFRTSSSSSTCRSRQAPPRAPRSITSASRCPMCLR